MKPRIGFRTPRAAEVLALYVASQETFALLRLHEAAVDLVILLEAADLAQASPPQSGMRND